MKEKIKKAYLIGVKQAIKEAAVQMSEATRDYPQEQQINVKQAEEVLVDALFPPEE